jgi:predicted nucleotidyltransferase
MAIDMRKVRENLAQRDRCRREELDILFAKATRDCAAIVSMIVDRYHPTRVVQWGSLLDRKHFTEVSDIDLAIEGVVEAQRYFELLKDAESLTTFPLDIVQLDKIDPLHRESILRKGTVIYERNT